MFIPFIPPNIKLALIFTKLAKDHGAKILHGNNVDLLTKDLGKALSLQKKIITDPKMGAVQTAYEILPVIIEVKILTLAVSKHLKIDTKDKPTMAILEEIIQKTDERGSKAAGDIKNTLEWTRVFFSNPEVQEILQAAPVEIKMPENWKDVKGIGSSALQAAQRISQEFFRLQEFLKKAKEPSAKKDDDKKDGPKPDKPGVQ